MTASLTTLADAHCHFFSAGFFRAVGRDLAASGGDANGVLARLGWDDPVDDESLADRWVAEFDRHGVRRAMLIASIPGDQMSVAAAVRRHPDRFVGAFMMNPVAPDAAAQLERAFEAGLRVPCLFPAMHRTRPDDATVEAVFAAAATAKAAVFVHCGVLSVGIRKRLGLPSPFDQRLGDPLAVAAVAVRHPEVPVIVPHFGAGMFREALMALDAAPNIVLDTSSSNGWIRYHPGLTLREVFARAIDVAGPDRLIFGTDSSFFPRGWQVSVWQEQRSILDSLGLDADAQARIFGGNFARIFGVRS